MSVLLVLLILLCTLLGVTPTPEVETLLPSEPELQTPQLQSPEVETLLPSELESQTPQVQTLLESLTAESATEETGVLDLDTVLESLLGSKGDVLTTATATQVQDVVSTATATHVVTTPSATLAVTLPEMTETGEVFSVSETYVGLALVGPKVVLQDSVSLTFTGGLQLANTVGEISFGAGSSLTVAGDLALNSLTFSGAGTVIFAESAVVLVAGQVQMDVGFSMLPGSYLTLETTSAQLALNSPVPDLLVGATVMGEGTLVVQRDAVVMVQSRVMVNILHHSREPFSGAANETANGTATSANHRLLLEGGTVEFWDNIGVHQVMCNSSAGAITTNASTALIVDTKCGPSDVSYLHVRDDSSLVFRNFTMAPRSVEALTVTSTYLLETGSTTKVWFEQGNIEDLDTDSNLLVMRYQGACTSENQLVVGPTECSDCQLKHESEGATCVQKLTSDGSDGEGSSSNSAMLLFLLIPATCCVCSLIYWAGRHNRASAEGQMVVALEPVPMVAVPPVVPAPSPLAQSLPAMKDCVACHGALTVSNVEGCEFCHSFYDSDFDRSRGRSYGRRAKYDSEYDHSRSRGRSYGRSHRTPRSSRSPRSSRRNRH